MLEAHSTYNTAGINNTTDDPNAIKIKVDTVNANRETQ